jgi:hypothetical protein
MMKTITFETAARRTRLVQKAEQLLQRAIEEPSNGSSFNLEGGPARIILDIEDGIGEEGFRIRGEPGMPVEITGNDERGLVYGIGKFLRNARFENGSLSLGACRGTFVPVKPVRGMYFATHFHNWYHDAPVEKVVRYVEELALWGCNALSVWFDMHHYAGIDDPDAVKMLDRLRVILKSADGVGIRVGLTSLANEGYATSPSALREYFLRLVGYHGPFQAYVGGSAAPLMI